MIRGGECEIPFPKPAWLWQECAVNVPGIAGVDNAKIGSGLAALPTGKLLEIDFVLKCVPNL